jgi:hypothetical protein
MSFGLHPIVAEGRDWIVPLSAVGEAFGRQTLWFTEQAVAAKMRLRPKRHNRWISSKIECRWADDWLESSRKRRFLEQTKGIAHYL